MCKKRELKHLLSRAKSIPTFVLQVLLLHHEKCHTLITQLKTVKKIIILTEDTFLPCFQFHKSPCLESFKLSFIPSFLFSVTILQYARTLSLWHVLTTGFHCYYIMMKQIIYSYVGHRNSHLASISLLPRLSSVLITD